MERLPTKRRTSISSQKSTVKSSKSRPKPTTPTCRSPRHATTSNESIPSNPIQPIPENPKIVPENPNVLPSSTQNTTVPQITKPSSSQISTQSSEGSSLVSSSFQAYDHPSEISDETFINDENMQFLQHQMAFTSNC